MTFSNMVTKLIDNIQLKQTVTKIKRYIDQIRNESGVENARRWVIELLQNARDVAFDDQKVKVKIVYDENNNLVTFSHNGRFFRTKDVLNIIHQVTSKDKDENAIGQFGTGFMSTYTLSEIVRIDGIAHDDENADLYKRFTVNINRTKNDSDGIEQSIKDSIDDFKKVDDSEAIDSDNIDRDAFNTTFSYYLQSDSAKKNAMIGIEDLIYNIKYIFLFSEKIESIEIDRILNDSHSYIVYKRESDVNLDELQDINVSTIIKSENGVDEKFSVIYKRDEESDVTVALEIDDISKKSVKKIETGTARLYIDFPLIGSEDYHIPFVVNSKKFKPNEERSLIYTSDSETSKNSVDNKNLMNLAIELYKDMIVYLNDNNYNNFENALCINPLKENKGTSKVFAVKNIFMDLLMFLYNLPMIDYDKDNNKTYILSKGTRVLAGNIKTIKSIGKILKKTNYVNFSLTKHNLYKMLKTYIDTLNENIDLICDEDEYSSFITHDKISGKCYVLERSFSLYNLACCAERIINDYLLDGVDYISFLNDVYETLKGEKQCFEEVINNDIRIFPIEKYRKYKSIDDIIFEEDETLLPYNKLYFDNVEDKELLRIAIPLMKEKRFVNKNFREQSFNYNSYEEMFSNVLDRKFNIDEEDVYKDKVLTDYMLKSYINDKMSTYALNDINNQSNIVQESAMLLASYIDMASNYTNNYELAGFVDFIDEESINSLRSKKVIANMTRELGEYNKFLKSLNINNIDELKDIINNSQNKVDDQEMLDDPLIEFENNLEREKWMREVGEFGEKKAYEIISDDLESLKNTSDMDSEYYGKEIELVNENTIEKKQGYDFSILIYDKDLLDDENFDKNDVNDTRIRRKQVEVKCSTKTSIYNNVIRLSNSQFKNAMIKGDDYIVYKILIDTKGSKNENDWAVVANYKYDNLLKAISNKKLNIMYPTFRLNDTSLQEG